MKVRRERIRPCRTVHRVVIACIDGNDLAVGHLQLQRDAVRQVDRHRVQALLLALPRMQTQRRVARADLRGWSEWQKGMTGPHSCFERPMRHDWSRHCQRTTTGRC